MGWFSKGLSGKQKEEALVMIRHLQTALAYQQLAMETINDALASVVGDAPVGAEVWARHKGYFNNPALVETKVMPSLERKIEIIRLMENENQLASKYAKGELSKPYQKMKSCIGIVLERADMQHQGWAEWIKRPEKPVDVSKLDMAERSAINVAVIALNELIQKVGLTTEEWLDIATGATNTVRDSIGLRPLDTESFRSSFIRGINGEKVRYFSE
jgi:hypothetical protein